jgi:hypothetical protein
MGENDVAIKKIGDLGKPGTTGHAVQLEVRLPRREVFRIIVPFLVASLALGTQNEDEARHELAINDE